MSRSAQKKQEKVDDLAKKIVDLIHKRDRVNKKKLSTKERIALLDKIYDGSLYWVLQCVLEGEFKGSGAASLLLERARQEIEYLTPKSDDSNVQKVSEIVIKIPE